MLSELTYGPRFSFDNVKSVTRIRCDSGTEGMYPAGSNRSVCPCAIFKWLVCHLFVEHPQMMKVVVRTARAVVSTVASFVSSSREGSNEPDSASAPDLVLFCRDESIIPKVVTSFQRAGFLVQELAPTVFGVLCKFEALLHMTEKSKWKRFTKS